MTTTTALEKCQEYNFDDVYAALKKLVSLVPPPDVKGKTVLLKPNILSPKKPEFAICTHPVVVGAAVEGVESYLLAISGHGDGAKVLALHEHIALDVGTRFELTAYRVQYGRSVGIGIPASDV